MHAQNYMRCAVNVRHPGALSSLWYLMLRSVGPQVRRAHVDVGPEGHGERHGAG